MKPILYFLASNILARLALLIINIIGAKILFVDTYGLLSYMLTLVATATTFVVAGSGVAINVIVSKYYSSNKEGVESFVGFSIILAFLFAPFICILISILNKDLLEKFEYFFVYLLLIVLVYFLNTINNSIYVGLKKYKELFFNNLYGLILFVLTAPLLIYKYEVKGALISIMLFKIFLILNQYFEIKRNKIVKINFSHPFNKFNINNFFKLSLPSFISGIVILPVLAISMSLVGGGSNGFESLGYFLIIYQIYLVAVFVPVALNSFYISRFSGMGIKADIKKVALINFVISTLLAIIMYLFKDIFWFILGDIYKENSANIFNIMLVVIILHSLSTVFSSYWPSVNLAWIGSKMNLMWGGVFLSSTYYMLQIVSNKQDILAYAFLISYSLLLSFQVIIFILTKKKVSINL